MNSFSRRKFIQTTSMGLGALAGAQLLPVGWAREQPAEAFIQPIPYDKAELRALAQQALDAARAAGARFADVRILTGHQFFHKATGPTGSQAPMLWTVARLGVRAVVGGHIGFAGEVLSPDADAIAAVARLAVARAKVGVERGDPPMEFAPAPAVTKGSWRTPIEIDPFTVPLGELEDLKLGALDALGKLKGSRPSARAGGDPIRGGGSAILDTWWKRADELFVSTEGSLIEQRIYWANLRSDIFGFWSGQRPRVFPRLYPKAVRSGGVGYEAYTEVDYKQECLKAAEEAMRLASLPDKSVEVGRYDVVLSAQAAAALLPTTIGGPLELDRALGLASAEHKRSKGSYAAPPEDCLGKLEVGSPLVTVTADRSTPGMGATVGWDAEGVKPEAFTLVKDGTVVDYLTTRETAPALSAWYASQKQPLRSHGCASDSGGLLPQLKACNFALLPGPAEISEEDLIKDVKRGIYIERISTRGLPADSTGLNMMVSPWVAHEIIKGRKAPGLVRDVAMQFASPQFWKSVDAIGGRDTVRSVEVMMGLAKNLELLESVGVSAAPIRARKINVINSGKKR